MIMEQNNPADTIAKVVEINEAADMLHQFTFAFLTYPDRIELRRLKEGESLWEIMKELTEGRFFCKTAELHYFTYMGQEKFLLIDDVNGDPKYAGVVAGNSPGEYRKQHSEYFHIEYRELLDDFSPEGNILEVKKYFNYDDDGQLKVIATRLVDIINEKGGPECE